MKKVALCALLACALPACASTTTIQPETAKSAAPDTPADDAAATHTIATEPVAATLSNKPWLHANTSSQYVHVGGAEQFVGVWVDVPDVAQTAHVPIALTLTIDTSGSMEGSKIVEARNAARELVSRMKEGDMVAIDTFSDHAREIVPPTVLDARTRQRVMSTISELSADGATNMFDALQLAISTARRAPSTHPVRRVVMISDGRATTGTTHTESLAQVAELGTQFGVQVTSLGVGLDYDEDALNAIAVRSSGRLFHLADAKEMPSIIKNELALLQKTMATQATVELVPAPGVQLFAAQGVRSSWGQSGALSIPLGTMFAGQRREVLVRFRMQSDQVEGNDRPIVSARLHFTDPSDDNVPRVQEVVVRAKLTNDMSLVERHANEDVQAIVAMQRASLLATEARQQISEGDFERADQQLALAESALRKRAEQAATKKDKARMMSAANSVASKRQAVRTAAKAPPAAQPEAARGAALDVNDFAMEAQGF